ncbi:hypothetical protein [Vibrio parahaemolyticus]|uniref:hypothetical protein n=1 Tax=Vibrio parahaemolyticus TaxID=670 RepID=UPI0011200FC3|nr:hypothetical protein [Vibrio parahaemolyticus]EHR6782881.1 hypothetical protein [Vibrio parahaemolyticus]MDF5575795.1 hypothetical protein [Vibrio parahaemolyticus]MDG2903396.1 hypothetical protein [Vibrio parahaemolyticus]TOH25012.1 hypothetical protein CGI83_22895 [Vibrio parahaemolyticus]HCG9147121.1 hypothetical protein [Vibrio parahaemolyticus]
MATEWVNVVDTAVKIGLGAVISGVFTYLGLKLSHRSDKEKFMLEHKTKLLEKIAEDTDIYFTALDSYIAKFSGITKVRCCKGETGNTLTKSQKDSLAERNNSLVESWAYQKSAIAKLRILKATKASKALAKMSTLEKKLRDRYVFDKDIPTYDEVKELQTEVRDQKRVVHEMLAEFYGTL